ncbi:MAG TPA: hypothetical protein DER20_11335 [Lachnospiraceae bacterium]|jgi:hypothetical protein|nr:hypothetical protein [Lachnospiraceae bacterium]
MIGSLGIKSGEPIIYRKKRVENMKKAKIIFKTLGACNLSLYSFYILKKAMCRNLVKNCVKNAQKQKIKLYT